MTTTIAFATRDCLVVGCDSLATSSSPVIDLHSFMEKFFDQDRQLKRNADGVPELHEYANIQDHIINLPRKSEPNVTKLFNLHPANCAVLFAGSASVGNESVSNLIDNFISSEDIIKYFGTDYTILGIAQQLADFISASNHENFNRTGIAPVMEIIVAGYSVKESKPEIHKILFNDDTTVEVQAQNEPGEDVIVFGGQAAEIKRIMFGIDDRNISKFNNYMISYLLAYRDKIEEYVQSELDTDLNIPFLDGFDDLPKINTNWALGIDSNISSFSEQAAINLVDFLIDIMIKSQEFDINMATVGGDIHIGLMCKRSGFKWISEENFSHRGNEVPKYKSDRSDLTLNNIIELSGSNED